MTNRNKSTRPITDLQQAILEFLWANGDATSDDVRAGLHSNHPLKDSSIRTLLRRLEERGLVTHRVDGKTFVYKAKQGSQNVAARAVRQIIDRFCAGSVEQFVLGMVDEKVMSAVELERLARKIRSAK